MSNVIGVDLGRHRSFCSLADNDGHRLVGLNDDSSDPGMWLRWSGAGPSERITDRVLRLAGQGQTAAVETVHCVVDALFPELAQGEHLDASPLVVVPAAFGPACRDAVIDGFAEAGVVLTKRQLIDRPIAALAHWLAHANAPDAGIVCLVDNDHGQLSMVAADLGTRRLLVCLPLSATGQDDPTEVHARLDEALARVERLLSGDRPADNPIIENVAAARRRRVIDHLVVSGTSVEHPRLVGLLADSLPGLSAEFAGDETAPVFGLLATDVFESWSAAWPTLTITLDDIAVSIDDFDLRSRDSGHSADTHLLVTPDSFIGLTDGANRVTLVAGSVQGDALGLPHDLGLNPRLRVFDDGRVLVLGDQGSRPVSMRVLWPAPSDHPTPVHVEAIGRRPVVLRNPTRRPVARPTPRATGDRPHRATAS